MTDMKNTTKYLMPILTLCLAAWVSTGFAAENPAAKSDGKAKAIAQPVNSTQETLKQMTSQLKLTEVQQQKMKKVLVANEQKMRELVAKTNLPPQELAAKGRDLRAANDQQLKEILTPDQYQQWQKFLAQRTIRRR
jgi:Spy/CpxP family protein refolding chaperone